MSTLSFQAKIVHASKSKSDNYYMVGFADDKYQTTHYIIMQKSIKKEHNEENSYLDEEYIEVDTQDQSAYDCCIKAKLTSKCLTITLDAPNDELNRVEVTLSEVKLSKKFIEYLIEILGDKLEIIETK